MYVYVYVHLRAQKFLNFGSPAPHTHFLDIVKITAYPSVEHENSRKCDVRHCIYENESQEYPAPSDLDQRIAEIFYESQFLVWDSTE